MARLSLLGSRRRGCGCGRRRGYMVRGQGLRHGLQRRPHRRRHPLRQNYSWRRADILRSPHQRFTSSIAHQNLNYTPKQTVHRLPPSNHIFD
ncbi:hypothetical protein EVAR_17636_1 [Eumeta japonica]|uniref:Uncharacterized protein n=1 Tax=Eumeta variegata TaxID=151549 RepID=A0A4C1USY0_EUMVA|nr:hypothetical protein EVAR_17636_1 [Eumeta japonica]